MADRQKMFGPTGGFSIGWPIQLNHAKFCGPTLVAMATKFWAIFSQKSPISRLVCQIDRICLGLPGDDGGEGGGILLGAESNRLPACTVICSSSSGRFC